MQPIVVNKHDLDNYSYERFALNEYILMENAGGNLARFVMKQLKRHKNKYMQSQVIFLCGGGNNGADGLVASRVLYSLYPKAKISIVMLDSPKSKLCKAQYEIIVNLCEVFADSYKNNQSLDSNCNARDIERKTLSMFQLFNSLQDISQGASSNFSIETIPMFQDKELDIKIKPSFSNLIANLLSLKSCDVVVDCIFGSGFNNANKTLHSYISYQALQQAFKKCSAIKIACDMPSGLPNILGHRGDIYDILGNVDYTLCMGVANISLFDSRIKDIVGKVKVLPLGISQDAYYSYMKLDEHKSETSFTLLEKSDLCLPLREAKDSNKGTYGTSYIIAGEMFGASLLSARAALCFGAGKVCMYEGFLHNSQDHKKDCEIIYTKSLPSNLHNNHNMQQYAFGIGMGLDYDELQYQKLFTWLYKLCGITLQEGAILVDIFNSRDELTNGAYQQLQSKHINIPFVFDADILARKELIPILKHLDNVVITPHPKELLLLLRNMNISKLMKYDSIESILRNTIPISQCLTEHFPNVVFLLKGSNTLIAHKNRIYINTQGKSNLAKGGSGDVLSGMITSLLAQGYHSLQAVLHASLAHAIASQRAFRFYDSYALTPNKLLKMIAKLS